MSIHTVDSKTSQFDFRKDRIGAGTIGGEHAVPLGFAGKTLNAVVDDLNTRIRYGSYDHDDAVVTQEQGNPLNFNVTQTIIGGTNSAGVQYSAATMNFAGTSIGVMGGLNLYSGKMTVLVDGVVTAGRVPIYMPLYIGGSTTNQAVLSSTATTIAGFSAGSGTFPSSGTILIGSELITYTGTSAGASTLSFTGCTRGTGGTTAKEHFGGESIYLWASSIDLKSANDFSTKQLLYYNPLLPAGEHNIIIYVTTGVSGYSRIYFDGFLTGSLVGSQNLFTQTGTVTISDTTDANGHRDLGTWFVAPNNVTIVGILGYTHVEAETSNTVPMLKLGLTRSSSYTGAEDFPYFFVHNGPASTAFTLRITVSYIGETI